MSLKIDRLQLEIEIKSDPARKELRELEDESKQLKRELKKLPEGSEEFIQKSKKLKEVQARMDELHDEIGLTGLTLNELNKRQKELNAIMRNLSPASQSYKDLEQQLQQVKGRMAELKGAGQKVPSTLSKIKTTAKTLLPAFGWMAIIGGIVSVIKKTAEWTSVTMKQRRQLQALTGETGKALSDITAKTNATAKTFEKDFDEMSVAVNSFASTMGVSYDEALGKVDKGFLAGADASGEYLDMLKEYGPQFKAAGLSADESIALITQQVNKGIYSDKGIDTIKEGTLRLREMTPATAEAIDAMGISSSQLQKDLAEGNISVMDAIKMVSNRIGELPAQSSVVGTAIADIFGGPGEDAGLEYIKMLGNVSEGLDEMVAKQGESASAQQKTLEANQKLEAAWAELIGSGTKGFSGIKAMAKSFIADGIMGMINGFRKLRVWFIDLYNNSAIIRGWVQAVVIQFKWWWNIAAGLFEYLISGFKMVGKAWGKILSGKFGQVDDVFKEGWAELKEKMKKRGQNIGDAFKKGFKETTSGKIEIEDPEVVEKEADAAGGSSAGNGGAGTVVPLTEEEKTAIEERKKAMEEYHDALAKYEDDRYKKTLSKDEQELLAIDAKYQALYEKAEAAGQDTTQLQLDHAEELGKKLQEIEARTQKELLQTKQKYGIDVSDELKAIELEALQTFYDKKLLSEEEFQLAKQAIERKYISKDVEDEYQKTKAGFEDPESSSGGKLENPDKINEDLNTKMNEEIAALEATQKWETMTVAEQEAERDAIRKKYHDAQQSRYAEQAKMIQGMSASVGAALGEMIVNQEVSMKDFGKNMIAMALDVLHDQLTISIAQAFFTETSTKGLAGLATGAALTVALEAAYQIAKSKVTQNEKGKYPVIGADDGITYQAAIGRKGYTGIYTEPTIIPGTGLMSEKDPELIVSGPHLRSLQMNYPGIIQSIYATRPNVPQHATGKYPTAPAHESELNKEMVNALYAVQNQLARSEEANTALTQRLSKPIKSNVVYSEITDMEDEVNDVEALVRQS